MWPSRIVGWMPILLREHYPITSEHWETGLILITSNRAFEERAQILDDDALSSAALDRLTCRPYTMVIQGLSSCQPFPERRCSITRKADAEPSGSQHPNTLAGKHPPDHAGKHKVHIAGQFRAATDMNPSTARSM